MIQVRPQHGMVDIVPPGFDTDSTAPVRFRVPAGAVIRVEPPGALDPADEANEYSPVPLTLEVQLVAHEVVTPGPGAADPVLASMAGWRYEVTDLRLSPGPAGGVTSKTLVSIRLPGLLRRALRPYITRMDPDGSFTIGSADPDDRAVLAYVEALLIGDHPTQAVAAELGVKPNAAAQRVFRLRRAGRLPYLAASKRGK